MLNIGPAELLAICVIALIVLGPDKLPQALRTLGRVTTELRRVSTGFQNEVRHALDDAVSQDWEPDREQEDRRDRAKAEVAKPSPKSNGSSVGPPPEEELPSPETGDPSVSGQSTTMSSPDDDPPPAS